MINFIGNLGAAIGNIMFSIILGIDCLSAFLGIGCIILGNITLRTIIDGLFVYC